MVMYIFENHVIKNNIIFQIIFVTVACSLVLVM